MEFVDLTMPVDWEWMPDEVFPTSTQLVVGPPRDATKGFILGNESATCILLPSQFEEFRKQARIDDLDVSSLVMRPTRILPLPCGAGCPISEQMLAEAFGQLEPTEGEAILIRTGWGDTLEGRRGSASYMLESPFLTPGGAEYLSEEMTRRSSELLLLDTALVGRPDSHIIPEWVSAYPRGAPWPSEMARGYLRGYTQQRVREDFAADYALARHGKIVVKKLVNCGRLPQGMVSVIVAPLLFVRAIGATCRVVAVIE